MCFTGQWQLFFLEEKQWSLTQKCLSALWLCAKIAASAQLALWQSRGEEEEGPRRAFFATCYWNKHCGSLSFSCVCACVIHQHVGEWVCNINGFSRASLDAGSRHPYTLLCFTEMSNTGVCVHARVCNTVHLTSHSYIFAIILPAIFWCFFTLPSLADFHSYSPSSSTPIPHERVTEHDWDNGEKICERGWEEVKEGDAWETLWVS